MWINTFWKQISNGNYTFSNAFPIRQIKPHPNSISGHFFSPCCSSLWPGQSGSHMLPQQHPAGSLHDNRDSRQVWNNIAVLLQKICKFTYIYIYAVYIHTHMHCVKKTLTTTLSEGWMNHKTQTESWRKSLKLWKRKRAKRKISRNVCKLKMVGSFDSGEKKLTFTRRTDTRWTGCNKDSFNLFLFYLFIFICPKKNDSLWCNWGNSVLLFPWGNYCQWNHVQNSEDLKLCNASSVTKTCPCKNIFNNINSAAVKQQRREHNDQAIDHLRSIWFSTIVPQRQKFSVILRWQKIKSLSQENGLC